MHQAATLTTTASGLAHLLSLYQRYLDNEQLAVLSKRQFFKPNYLKQSLEPIVHVLSPNQIDLFLQSTMIFEDHQNYVDLTGLFVTKLVQNSYSNGYNDFILNTMNLPALNRLGSYLCAGLERDEPRCIVRGDIGGHCFEAASGIALQLKGDAGTYFGKDLKSSSVEVWGDIDRNALRDAHGCVMNLHGKAGMLYAEGARQCLLSAEDVEECCGEGSAHSAFYLGIAGNNLGGRTKHCFFFIRDFLSDNVGIAFYAFGSEPRTPAAYSTFATANADLLEKLRYQVPEGNRVVFFEHERETMVMDYTDKD